MSFSLAPEDVKKSTEVPKKPYAIGVAVLAAVAVAGILLILNFAFSQRENTLLTWQQNLGGVAQVRAGAIASWVRQQQAPLIRFAEDADVRLSVTQIMEPSADLDLGSRGYLRNWLASMARDNGYLPPEVATQLEANAQAQTSHSGLAIVSKEGEVLVSAGLFPAHQAEIKEYVKNWTPESPRLIDLFRTEDGSVYVGFVQPVYGLSGAVEEANRTGLVIGVKPVATELWPLLEQPGAMLTTGEVLLLRKGEGTVTILSPVGDKKPLEAQFDLGTANLIEAQAARAPGTLTEGKNHAGIASMGSSRLIEDTPWVLSYQASTAEMLADGDRRLRYQVMIFAALLGMVLLFLYAAWRRGAAIIAAQKAQEYAALARRFEFQSKLLRLITDSQRNHIMIADTEGRVRFANATLAKDMETQSEDLIGKPLAAAVGPDTARRYAKRSQEASLSNKAVVTVDRMHLDETGERFKVVQTQHIPLEDHSAGPGETPSRGTLIVEEDITDVVMEREKRERVLRGVVDALVAVVDRRDPFAAEHSSRVARLSRSIAAEMGLSDIDTDAVELAGALLNLGKLLVPANILTKQGQLDESELKVVRDSLLASADIVARIEFEGPVVETLRQSLEKFDGSGFPEGRKGEDIAVTARILAVANAFVALISPRAHRSGMTIDEACRKLMDLVDSAYDRRVIAALVSYIDNKGGREVWELVAAPAPQMAPEAPPADDNPWQR
jgi:HD-GYP domain-containing protein (c-di-GMP phosphodiesterase class II)